jgi:hypothetical protein
MEGGYPIRPPTSQFMLDSFTYSPTPVSQIEWSTLPITKYIINFAVSTSAETCQNRDDATDALRFGT